MNGEVQVICAIVSLGLIFVAVTVTVLILALTDWSE